MRSFIFLTCFILSFSHVSAMEYEGKYLSNSLKNELERWKTAKKNVNAVYLQGTSWIANAGTDVKCSTGVLETICNSMKTLASSGAVVRDYAQAPTGEYVILSTQGAFYSHRPYFSNLGLVSAIDQFSQQQKRVNSVALFENGGWLLIAQGEVKSRNLPRELTVALQEAQLGEHFLTRIFSRFTSAQETQWILTANADYWTNRTDSYLQDSLHRFMKERYYLGPVAFDGSRYLALVRHKRILTKPFDRFENQIKKNLSHDDQHILARMEHYQVPAVSVAVIDGDSIITRTYGVLNNSSKLKAQTTSYYPSASLSKAVFSYGMLKAHEQGILNLDQNVYDFAQAYPNGLVRKWVDSLPSTRDEPYLYRSKVMTFRSLLSHSGGTSVHGIGVYRRNQMRTLSDLIMGTNRRSKTNPIDFPHQSMRYSGGGYSIVEAALEDVTGQKAEDWLDLNVIVPLGMEGSTFGFLHPSREARLARGHSQNSNPMAVGYCPGKGAGGLISNAHNYARFIWTVMNQGAIYQSNRRFINYSSHQQVFTPAHRLISSLERCSQRSDCLNEGEICALNKCVLPVTDNRRWRHHGPGQMHSRSWYPHTERGVSFLYPTFTEHGGSQDGIRTKFWYNYREKKGIVIYTNSKGEWLDENENPQGANPLIDELIATFKRVW